MLRELAGAAVILPLAIPSAAWPSRPIRRQPARRTADRRHRPHKTRSRSPSPPTVDESRWRSSPASGLDLRLHAPAPSPPFARRAGALESGAAAPRCGAGQLRSDPRARRSRQLQYRLDGVQLPEGCRYSPMRWRHNTPPRALITGALPSRTVFRNRRHHRHHAEDGRSDPAPSQHDRRLVHWLQPRELRRQQRQERLVRYRPNSCTTTSASRTPRDGVSDPHSTDSGMRLPRPPHHRRQQRSLHLALALEAARALAVARQQRSGAGPPSDQAGQMRRARVVVDDWVALASACHWSVRIVDRIRRRRGVSMPMSLCRIGRYKPVALALLPP